MGTGDETTLNGAPRCKAKAGRGRCRKPAMTGFDVCADHGAKGGRPIESGRYSKLRARYPSVGAILDGASSKPPQVRALESLALAEAITHEIVERLAEIDDIEHEIAPEVRAVCPLCSEVNRLQVAAKLAKEMVYIHTELAKQARFWSEATANKAIAATNRMVISVLASELQPEQMIRVERKMRQCLVLTGG